VDKDLHNNVLWDAKSAKEYGRLLMWNVIVTTDDVINAINNTIPNVGFAKLFKKENMETVYRAWYTDFPLFRTHRCSPEENEQWKTLNKVAEEDKRSEDCDGGLASLFLWPYESFKTHRLNQLQEKILSFWRWT
jgi:hypothetical protein